MAMGPKPPVLPVSSTAVKYRRTKSEASSAFFAGLAGVSPPVKRSGDLEIDLPRDVVNLPNLEKLDSF
jgi:hypothetical protein